MGACGFKIENDDTHGGYYAEKLGFNGRKTSLRIGELINVVKKELKNSS